MTQTEQQNVPALRFPGFEETWEDLKLGDFLEIKSASRVHKDEWRETGVPFFRSSDVVSAFKGNENKKAFISNTLFEKLAKKSSKVAKGDLLVTGGGSIGVPYLIQSDAPLYFKDADLLWIRNSGEVEGFYLYTFFSSPIFRRYVQSITHIGTISHYTIEQARATPINLPTLPEQRKIAGFLGAVDERIAQVTRKKALLEDYKKGCMQQLFSQSIHFKDDQGNDFPDWEEKRLGDVAQFSKGKGISKADIEQDGENLCIRYGELYTEYREYIPEVVSRTDTSLKGAVLSRKNDVLMPTSDVTPSGLATASAIDTDGVILGGDILIIRSKKILNRFFAYFIAANKPKIMRLVSGVTVYHIYGSDLATLHLEIPHPDEQEKIADVLSAIDNKIDLVTRELTQARSFKAGLLQQMFV